MIHYLIDRLIDLPDTFASPLGNLVQGGDDCLDWMIVYFGSYLIIVQFIIHFAAFYEMCRVICDMEQFLLSPAFNLNDIKSIPGEGDFKKEWEDATIFRKFWNVQVTTDCLMPDGPSCTLTGCTTSEIWRSV